MSSASGGKDLRGDVYKRQVLKRCSQVDPGVVTAGNVTLRERSHVHTGATLINRVEIGEDAVIGAGAVVLRSVPSQKVFAGVPAREIRNV